MMGEFFGDDPPHGKVKRIMWYKYLQAFIAKTQSSDSIAKTIICDVFAGPGIYKNHGWSPVFTDYGSPLVALRAAIEYFMRKNKLNKTFEPIPGAKVPWTWPGPAIPEELEYYKIDFHFVEKDGNNYESLVDNIILFFDFHGISNFAISFDPQVPDQCKYAYVYSTDASFPIRCFISNCEFVKFTAPNVPDNARMVTFIDPFGYSMIPWTTVCNFVGEHKDLFINLMTSFMNRFFKKNRDNISKVFGIEPEVLQTLRCEDKSNFVDTLVELYVETTSSDYALTFEVRNIINARLYHLIFATSHIKGLEAMKECFNRGTQEKDSFSLSDFKILKKGIPLNLGNQQDPKQVANVIFGEFKGSANVSIEDIKRFVLLDTPYVHRKKPLAVMQKDKRIEKVVGIYGETQARRNTFPDHTEWFISFRS